MGCGAAPVGGAGRGVEGGLKVVRLSSVPRSEISKYGACDVKGTQGVPLDSYRALSLPGPVGGGITLSA